MSETVDGVVWIVEYFDGTVWVPQPGMLPTDQRTAEEHARTARFDLIPHIMRIAKYKREEQP
jgi:hypothetical protein